jgi:hypothetical protein
MFHNKSYYKETANLFEKASSNVKRGTIKMVAC